MICIVSRLNNSKSFTYPFLVLYSVIGYVQFASGQTTSNSNLRFTLSTSSKFGPFLGIPGQWCDLHLQLENRGDAPRDVLCTTYFDGDANLQFGRQVWIPAHSRLTISHPALMPKAETFKENTALLHSLVIDRSSGNEVAVNTDSGLINDHSLLISPTERNTAIIAGWKLADNVPQDEVNLVIASRVSQGLINKATVLGEDFLPTDESNLAYLDHLILAEDRLADDYAALAAIRRWLHAGGRLWVMLDRVDPVILERLFGDEFQCQVVDRVRLSNVRVDAAPSVLEPNGKPGDTISYENPLDMARIVVSGMQIWNTVDGWPAAATMSYGDGRVLITTLGARGWIKPTPPWTSEKKDERPATLKSDFTPLLPMQNLAGFILSSRDPEVLPQTTLEPLANEYVSYKIPNWTSIVGTMGLFLVALLVTGIWFYRVQRLEHFGWSGSLLAIVFGAVLAAIGFSTRYAVPETIVSVQVAQAIVGTDDVRSRGTIAVYRPEGSSSPIQSTHGGKIWPEMKSMEGSTRRMVTTDLGAFHWEGLKQPPGVRVYPYTSSDASPRRIEATATLDATGIVGSYSGPSTTGEDVTLATRYGRMGVRLTSDGKLAAAAEDVYKSNQYLNATFLGDVQDRRRRILQDLFSGKSWKNRFYQPKLLLWLNDWPHGFQFGEALNHQGETLLMIPLELSRPATGTEILIPSPLLEYGTALPPDGSIPAGFWNDVTGEWQERSSPSSTWLRFQIPRALLPLKASKAQLEVNVSGPMGRIEILGVNGNQIISLQSVQNPVGALTFDIDDPNVLLVGENGDLVLGVSAGASTSEPGQPTVSKGSAPADYWRIESLALKLWATVSELTEQN